MHGVGPCEKIHIEGKFGFTEPNFWAHPALTLEAVVVAAPESSKPWGDAGHRHLTSSHRQGEPEVEELPIPLGKEGYIRSTLGTLLPTQSRTFGFTWIC